MTLTVCQPIGSVGEKQNPHPLGRGFASAKNATHGQLPVFIPPPFAQAVQESADCAIAGHLTPLLALLLAQGVARAAVVPSLDVVGYGIR